MKIEVPIFIQHQEDEGLKLLVAFLFRLSRKKSNGFKGVRYYMHVSDIRYFLRKWVMQPHAITDALSPHIRVGKANQHIWMLDWTRDRPATSEYEIKDPEMAAVWGYIIGREMAGAEMVTPTEGIPEQEESQISNREDKNFFQYFGIRDKI